MQISDHYKQIFTRKENIWLVIILTLVGLFVLNAVLAASGHPLISSAFSRGVIVNLFDENGELYPPVIELNFSDETIQVGWKASRASSCFANSPFDNSAPWSNSKATSIHPVTLGPFTKPETVISVVCKGKLGSASASMTVRQQVTNTKSLIFSPKKGDTWVVGKTYNIQWKNSSTDCRRDPSCLQGNPLPHVEVDCMENQTCLLNTPQSSSLSSSSPPAVSSHIPPVSCQDGTPCYPPIPKPSIPPPNSIPPTITLNHPQPACANDPVHPCLMPIHSDYYIKCDAQGKNLCTWTIPAKFDPYFLGEVLITVAPNDGRSSFSSDVFTIIQGDQSSDSFHVKVKSPNGGEIWAKDVKEHQIDWSAPANVTKINISLIGDAAIDCGSPICPVLGRMSSQYPIATQTNNDGSFVWTKISTVPAGTYKVTVSDADGSGSDDSDGVFYIVDKTADDALKVNVNEAFSMQLGQTVAVQSNPITLIKYSDFIPKACAKSSIRNCFGIVKLTSEGVSYTFQRAGDIRYVGQGGYLRVQLLSDPGDGSEIKLIANQ